MMGRIEHVHRDTPNLQEALRHYRELTESSSHPIAQRAFARVIMLELFTFDSQDPQRTGAQAKLPELSRRAAQLTDVLAIRMAELTLAHAIFYFGWDKAQGIIHAERALSHGIVRERLEADVTMMVARASEQLGDTAKSLEYYRKFEAAHKRDNRHYTAMRKIRELEQSAAGAAVQALPPTPSEPTPAEPLEP